MRHALAIQLAPAFANVHRIPHAPQFSGSVVVGTSQPSARDMLQSAKPALHVMPHAPPAQVGDAFAAGGHTVRHIPQWVAAVFRSVSQPLARMPSQSPNPGRHVSRHIELAQSSVPLGAVPHAVPHAPQLRESLVTSTQTPPHIRVDPEQIVEQLGEAPAEHIWPIGHARPQPPQFALSTRFCSQPFIGLLSQSAKPALQTSAQRPAVHVATPLTGVGHAVPHAPQFDGDSGTHPDGQRTCPAPQPLSPVSLGGTSMTSSAPSTPSGDPSTGEPSRRP